MSLEWQRPRVSPSQKVAALVDRLMGRYQFPCDVNAMRLSYFAVFFFGFSTVTFSLVN